MGARMRDDGTTTARRGTVRVLAAAALPVGLLGATMLAVALAARLSALLPVDLATATVDRVVEIAVVSAGIALLVWLAWGLAVATLCAAARTLGVTWRAGERLVARHAPDLVRRALVVALGAGLGVSGAVAAHATAPGDGLDVGWSATTSSAPTSVQSTAPAARVDASPDASPAVGDERGTPAPGPARSPATAPTGSAGAASGDPAGASDVEAARGDGTTAGTGRSSAAAPEPAAPASSAASAASTEAEPAAPRPRPHAPSVDAATAPPTGAPADVATRTSGRTPTATGAVGAAAPAASPHAEPGPGASAVGAEPTVVVAAGDSLWRIAQRALGPDASDQEVAAEWPRWYAANADVIGADPDHVVPGQVLRTPGGAAAPGGTR